MRGLRPITRVTQQTAAAKSAASLSNTNAATRYFSVTQRRAGGAPEFDPPTGWLFGVRPGEKYKKEGWEDLMLYGFGGSLAVFAIVYAFKPDTSITTWALEEARRRLEAEGILEDPEKK